MQTNENIEAVGPAFYPSLACDYRSLEQSGLPQVEAWVDKQRELATRWLASRGCDRLDEELALFDFERRGTPAPRLGYQYFWRQRGTEQTIVEQAPSGAERSVAWASIAHGIDPIIGSWNVSPDRRYLAYQACDSAAEIGDMRFVALETPHNELGSVRALRRPVLAWHLRPDTLTAVGLYYGRSGAGDLTPDEPDIGLYCRDLVAGSAQRVWMAPSRGDMPQFVTPMVSSSGRRLILMCRYGADPLYGLNLAAIDERDGTPRDVREIMPAGVSRCIARFNAAEQLIILSDHECAEGALYRCDFHDSDLGSWQRLFTPPPGGVIRDFGVIKDYVGICVSRSGGTDVLLVRQDTGSVTPVSLPGVGSASRMTADQVKQRFWVSYSDLLRPASVLECSPTCGTSVWFRPGPVEHQDGLRTSTRTISADDESSIPITLFHRGELGQTVVPTVLEVYGGFGRSLRARFRADVLQWIRAGGVWAVAHIRGGGETGARGRDSGRGRGKVEAVTDCALVAEHLVAQGITDTSQLGLVGVSNGGLLAAAAAILHPELFRACAVTNPVTDLERFPLLGDGRSWIAEYGDPSDKDTMEMLLSYSPFHNAQRPRPYPAFLIIVGTDDRRVPPAHGMKLCAALQRHSQSRPDETPVLLVPTPGGHVVQSPTLQREITAARLGFLASVLALEMETA